MPNRSSKQKLVVRDNSKFLGCRGRVYKQGGPKLFMAFHFFFCTFSRSKKEGAIIYISLSKKGKQIFLLVKF